MNEKPILFNTEMVRAVIRGDKTQTRRVIKPQPKRDRYIMMEGGELVEKVRVLGYMNTIRRTSCPYGQAGHQLWVRETHCNCGGIEETYYKASDKEITDEERLEGMRWSPSIHMPRWLSRIQLEVLQISAERVNNISEQDAIAEGVLGDEGYPYENGELPCPSCNGYGVHGAVGACLGYTEVDCVECDTYKKRFKILWNSINEKRGFGWDTNPWVWVVKFKRLEEPCENSDR